MKISPWLFCFSIQLILVLSTFYQAEPETDEVFAQLALLPEPEEVMVFLCILKLLSFYEFEAMEANSLFSDSSLRAWIKSSTVQKEILQYLFLNSVLFVCLLRYSLPLIRALMVVSLF